MQEKEFDGQRSDEEVELVFRRHIVTIWRGVFMLIALTIIGAIPMVVFPGERKWFLVWLGALAIGMLLLLYRYFLWYFSYYILTNQRIRQVQQRGLFRKTVVDVWLGKVSQVGYKIPGIFGGIFGYGTILLQMKTGKMKISMVENPKKTYNILQDLIDRVK